MTTATATTEDVPKGIDTEGKKKPISGPRIVWTPEHIKTMTDAYPDLLTIQDNRARFDLAMKAQELLPKEFQRTYAGLYWLAVRDADALKRILGLLPPLPKRSIKPETLDALQEGRKKWMQEHPEGTRSKKAPEPPKPKTAVAKAIEEEIAKLEHDNEVLKVQAKEATKAKPEKPEKHSVRWNLTKFAFLAHDPKVKSLIENKSYNPPNVTMVDAVMRAQHKYFPRNEWRPRQSVFQSCYGHPGLLNQLRMGLAVDNPHPKPEPAPTTPPSPVEAPQSAAKAVAAGNPVAEALSVLLGAFMPAIERTLTNAFVAAIKLAREPDGDAEAKLLAGVRETVIDILGAPAAAPEPKPQPEPAPMVAPEQVRRAKTRVDIVGLLGDQEQVVRQRYGELFDLRFIGAKEVERQKITAPVAIMCRKFVSHSAQDRIRKSGASLVYANGGADSVVQHLTTMAEAA